MFEQQNEEWKPLDLKGRYWVSNMGEVRSKTESSKGNIRVSTLSRKPYRLNRVSVMLMNDKGNPQIHDVMRLVVNAFAGAELDERKSVIPIDGNYENCSLSNLKIIDRGDYILARRYEGIGVGKLTPKFISIIRGLVNLGMRDAHIAIIFDVSREGIRCLRQRGYYNKIEPADMTPVIDKIKEMAEE